MNEDELFSKKSEGPDITQSPLNMTLFTIGTAIVVILIIVVIVVFMNDTNFSAESAPQETISE